LDHYKQNNQNYTNIGTILEVTVDSGATGIFMDKTTRGATWIYSDPKKGCNVFKFLIVLQITFKIK